MGILDSIFRTNDGIAHAMRLALKSKDAVKINKTMVDLQVQTERLTKKDIQTWRSAWQQAINHESPRRMKLYEVYTDVSIDMHLTGCIGQRKGMVLCRPFKLVDRAGKEDRRATELLQEGWFDDFVSMVLDSRFWGHSLIEMGDVIRTGDSMRYSHVSLTPRAHVVPEYGVILRNPNDEIKQGISYREGGYSDWCIEAGGSHDLGLLLKCAPSALSKKNMLAFWDGFGEVFGMPIRIAKTSSRDNAERNRMLDMLSKMGSNWFGVFSDNTEIEIKETTRGDAFNVYDRRIDRANSELSKGVLNQTMTIDSGSSLSQSEVHLEIFENVVAQDQTFVRNVVNNKLLPLMARHGFPVEGFRFEWNDSIVLTADQQQKVEDMILTQYDVDPAYFKDKYRIPVLGKKEHKTTNLSQPFFD